MLTPSELPPPNGQDCCKERSDRVLLSRPEPVFSPAGNVTKQCVAYLSTDFKAPVPPHSCGTVSSNVAIMQGQQQEGQPAPMQNKKQTQTRQMQFKPMEVLQKSEKYLTPTYTLSRQLPFRPHLLWCRYRMSTQGHMRSRLNRRHKWNRCNRNSQQTWLKINQILPLMQSHCFNQTCCSSYSNKCTLCDHIAASRISLEHHIFPIHILDISHTNN